MCINFQAFGVVASTGRGGSINARDFLRSNSVDFVVFMWHGSECALSMHNLTLDPLILV